MSISTAFSRFDSETTSSLRSAQTPSFRKSALEIYKIEVSLYDFTDTFVPGFSENLEISLVLQHMLNFKTWKGSYPYNEDDNFKQLFDGKRGATRMGRDVSRETMVVYYRSHAEYTRKNFDHQTVRVLLSLLQTIFKFPATLILPHRFH